MNEMVRIKLWSYFDKITLKNSLDDRVQALGLGDSVFDLDLGFTLDEGWPAAEKSEILLSELIVIGRKLKLNIMITRLSMEPVKENENGND